MIEDIILRTVENAPLTTKGSALTWEEVDGNWVEIYNALAGIEDAGLVTAYNETHSYYTGEFVTRDGKLYRALQGDVPGDNSGELPEETDSEFWVRVSPGELLSAAGREPAPSFTGAQLAGMILDGRLIVGGRYKCTDFTFEALSFPIIFTAVTASVFQERVSTETASYLMDVDSTNADSANWLAKRVQNYALELNLSNSAIYNPTTKALTIAESSRHAEVFNLVADAWGESTAYEINDVVEHDGSVYIALMSTTDDEPGTSPTAWELIHGTGYPEIATINDISSTHDSKFQVSGISVQMNAGSAVAGNIILDLNTNVLLTSYGFIKLRDIEGINRKEASGLLN